MHTALHYVEAGTHQSVLHITVNQDNSDGPAFVGDGPGHAMSQADMPLTESLQDTFHRLLPLWHDSIAPAIKSNKRVLIVAHGNSIRVCIIFAYHVVLQAYAPQHCSAVEPWPEACWSCCALALRHAWPHANAISSLLPATGGLLATENEHAAWL